MGERTLIRGGFVLTQDPVLGELPGQPKQPTGNRARHLPV